jgi:DNA-binding transcriptional regulator GbsR (MarR family)
MFKRFILPKNKVNVFFEGAKKIEGFNYSAEKDTLTFGQNKDITLSRDGFLPNYSVLIFKLNLETGKTEEEADASVRIKNIIQKISNSLKTNYLEVDKDFLQKILELNKNNKTLEKFFKCF